MFHWNLMQNSKDNTVRVLKDMGNQHSEGENCSAQSDTSNIGLETCRTQEIVSGDISSQLTSDTLLIDNNVPLFKVSQTIIDYYKIYESEFAVVCIKYQKVKECSILHRLSVALYN